MPEFLDKYLIKKVTPKFNNIVKKTIESIDYVAMKKRIVSFVKNFNKFPEHIVKYIESINYFTVDSILDYINLIKKDIDVEVDFIIAETKELEKKIPLFLKFGKNEDIDETEIY